MAALTSLFSLATISGGMRGGPNSETKVATLNGAMPASTVVGTSGSRPLRAGRRIASGRSLPSLRCARVEAGVAKVICVRPAITSTMVGASPL